MEISAIKPVAALLVPAVAVFLSFHQKIGLEREIPYSIARGFLQLFLIGFVLQFIFLQQNVRWILAAFLFMVSVAAYTAGQRAKHVPYSSYVAGVSILAGTSFTLCLLLLLNVFPLTPRYIIPISGMMVTKAMTVTGVTMRRLREDLKHHQILVETALALGASPRQAIALHVRRAVLLALSPPLDTIKTIGLISVPGTMTGLIMGGASPYEAIKLQMVVMSVTIGASAFSSMMSTYLCWRIFFTKTYQLETEVLMADSY